MVILIVCVLILGLVVGLVVGLRGPSHSTDRDYGYSADSYSTGYTHGKEMAAPIIKEMSLAGGADLSESTVLTSTSKVCLNWYETFVTARAPTNPGSVPVIKGCVAGFTAQVTRDFSTSSLIRKVLSTG